MTLDDDSLNSLRPAPRARSRIFLDPVHETPSNIKAWREGLEATRTGDAVGMARALSVASGRVQPLGRSGAPRRDPISKAIFKLRDDPQAWRRLRTSVESCGILGAHDVEGSTWEPGSVNLVSFMWSQNPQALALAARVWRASCQASENWWRCPFLARPWEGPVELADTMRRALNAHRPQLDFNPQRRAIDAVPESERGPELQALETIFTETARACIESLGRVADSERKSREEGKTVWARGGNYWGLDWTRHVQAPDFAFKDESARAASLPKTELTCSQRAVDAILADALALSPLDACAAAARLALNLQDTQQGALSLHALSSLLAGNAEVDWGHLFDPHDWMEPRLVARFACSDDQLARFLAGPGSSWSAPALTGSMGELYPTAPAWSHRHESWRHIKKGTSPVLDDWTVLEWMLIMGRPEAALRACQLGAQLRPSFERAVGTALRWSFQTPQHEVQAFTEACRIAESIQRPDRPPTRGHAASRL